jgi:hypothetical protein
MHSLTLDTLSAWQTHLSELGRLGEVLCTAVERNDIVTAIATMMDTRRVRADLARVDAPERVDGNLREHAAMRAVSESTVGARFAEAAIQHWRTRKLPPQTELLATPLGTAVLADAILPEVWDFDVDLVVLVGRGLEGVAQVLGDVGHKRIILCDGDPVTGAIVTAHEDEIEIAVRSMVPVPPRQLVVHSLAGIAAGRVTQIRDAVQDALYDLRIHRNTMHAFSKTWFEQSLANIASIARAPSVCAFDDTFVGVPMIIVAPGPSLARNADQLRALAGRAIICAFSHSLKPVLAAGVTPDIVLTVDPQDVRYHFTGCDTSQLTLVNGVTVHPSLFEMPAKRHITLSANGSVDDWMFEPLGEQPVVPGGGSVATTALSLALRWKCDPIIFLGLDLSFPGGNYYVSTSSDGDARAEVDANGVMQVAGWSAGFTAMKAAGGPPTPTERAVTLPGWHGGTVPSSFMFSLFHRWFEHVMAQRPDARVYNCTEGGARIAGMRHERLADVTPLLTTEYDIEARLRTAEVAVPQDRSTRLVRHLVEQVTALRQARGLARRGRALIARRDTGPALEWVERELAITLAPLDFVALLAQREVERALDTAHRTTTEHTYLAASASLMQTLGDIIDKLLPSIESAIVRIPR